MLFPYKYVKHTMEKMQGYIDFIFYEVWCRAKGNDYDIEVLFSANDELRQLVTELHTSELKAADFFLTGLQQLFQDFQVLDNGDIEKLKHWYISNNKIDCLCGNDSSVTCATYSLIEEELSSEISNHLKDFYQHLYSQNFLSLSSIKSRIGDIDDHYKKFVITNNKGKCPFCGINDIKGIYHSKREAYDHYLPKGQYPFNSINFRNLAPACHECNSTYKLSQDPLTNVKDPLNNHDGGRRKSFYSYQTDRYNIELHISLTPQNWTPIKPENIKLKTGPNALREELDTWLDVYGIEERYKAKCCGENDGKYWIEQVLDECKNDGRTPDEIFSTLIRQAKNWPYADTNFLKKTFLEACNGAGLFNI